MKALESITAPNQPPLLPSNDNNDKLDGSPQLKPSTVERLANIAMGGTIGVGIGMAAGIGFSFLKNGWGGGDDLLNFMGIGLMLCGTIGMIIGAVWRVSLPDTDATESRREQVA
jgi:hypothetical protein